MSCFVGYRARWLIAIGLYVVSPCGWGLTYNITLNTSTLIGHPAGPFSVALQLTDASGLGDGNNTITISACDFGGGSAVGTPITLGGVTGSLNATATITDRLFLNFIIQRFNPGQHLSCQVTTTTNVDVAGGADQLSLSILDNTGQEIPTQTGVPFFNPFLTITIELSAPTVQRFAADPTRTPGGGGPPLVIDAPLVFNSPVDAFQLKYFNTNYGSGQIIVSNAGTLGLGTVQDESAGTICANFYSFDPNEEIQTCCSCPVTPNGLASLNVNQDIVAQNLIVNPSSAITVKLLFTKAARDSDGTVVCDATTPTTDTLAGGGRAWGTNLRPVTFKGGSPITVKAVTETPFAVAELSATELFKLTTFCKYVQILGSNVKGICKSCRFGALGAYPK